MSKIKWWAQNIRWKIILTYRRFILRNIIRYIHKHHFDSLTPIYGYTENDILTGGVGWCSACTWAGEKGEHIIAWKWAWTVTLEKDLKVFKDE